MAGLPPAIVDNTVTAMPSWVTASHTYYGYCSIADVQLEFLAVANMPSSADNPNVVAQCITQAAIEMQNALELVYQMPYAGTDSVIKATLSELNAKLAAANVYDRTFGANEPDASSLGALLRSYAEIRIKGIIDGEEQWGPPFHDAVPQSERPLYPRSAVGTVMPDPKSADPFAARPVFTMGRTQFSRDGLM